MAGKSAHEIDILNGSIWKKYLLFILPLAAGNILQLLFNAADIIVVGRFAGTVALAAVGATTAIVNFYLQIYTGISTGVNIVLAGAYATNHHDRVSRIVHSTAGLVLLGGLGFMLIGLVTVKPLLLITGTPEDILGMAHLYMLIYCLGMPASVAYNFGASILRSIGDTRRPMFYLIAAGIVNLILNIISVIVLGMGVAGVAIATTVSNYISAALVIRALMRESSSLKLELRRISMDPALMMEVLKHGLPVAIQNSFFTIPNIMIQSAVNSFGSLYVAGNAASQSIEGFQFSLLSANGVATATFMSQHVNARKFERADKALRTIEIGSCIFSIAIAAVFLGLHTQLLGLYNQDPEVIAIGFRRMRIMMLLDFMDVTMCVLSNAIRGYGKAMEPTVITLIFVCGFRVIWLFFLFPYFHFYEFVIMAWPITWVLANVVLYYVYRKTRADFPRVDEAMA